MAAVIPFRTAAQLQVQASLDDIKAHVQRETARLNAECQAAHEEAEAIQRGYVERQKRIERLLADIKRHSERT